jgi:hypothetical protein
MIAIGIGMGVQFGNVAAALQLQIPVNAILFNGKPILFNGKPILFSKP